MTHPFAKCAGCFVAFAGLVVLAFPSEAKRLAEEFASWIKADTSIEITDPGADARRFDEIAVELVQIDNLPRPEMDRDPYLPLFSTGRIASVTPKPQAPRSILRIQKSSRLHHRQSYVSRPNGIFARSRYGSHNAQSKSIFEQSRSYHRHGSAFERIRLPRMYGH